MNTLKIRSVLSSDNNGWSKVYLDKASFDLVAKKTDGKYAITPNNSQYEKDGSYVAIYTEAFDIPLITRRPAGLNQKTASYIPTSEVESHLVAFESILPFIPTDEKEIKKLEVTSA